MVFQVDYVPGQNPNGFVFQLKNTDDTFVAVKVYDLSGRLVATPLREHQQRGRHEFAFVATSLASGTCIYRLETAEGSQSRKFTLLK